MEFAMRGKNAIITGARSGIGKATVELFAENGANVWAGLRQPNPEFEAWADELGQRHGVWVKPVYFDLTDEEAVKVALKGIFDEKKQIDVLVNNAGVAHGSFLQMTSMNKLREVFAVNFFAQVLLMQLVSRVMVRRKSGAIVNLASVAGLDGEAGYTAYGSSKAALAFATRTASRELAPLGVRVNAVAPGLIQTPMMDLMEENAKKGMISGASLGRPGETREVAEAILFLASDKSSFITGQILRVDGGL
jgi:3-oxoacyl-[acyl-carrier protein] reductase